MKTIHDHGVSGRELLVFFYKYRARFILAFLLPFLFFVVVSFVPTPKFTANSVLIVRLGPEYVYEPETSISRLSASSPLPFSPEEIFKSEVAILSSDDLHAAVIDKIGYRNMYPELTRPGLLAPITQPIRNAVDSYLVSAGLKKPMTPDEHERFLHAAALQKFDKAFDISLEKESAVITLGFQNPDSDIAVRSLQTLLDLYIEKRKNLYLEPRTGLAAQEAETTHDKAAAAEKAVNDFKQNNKVYSIEEQRSALLGQRSDLEKQLMTMPSPYSDALRERIGDLNRQLDRLGTLEHQYDTLQNDAHVAEDEYAAFQHKLDEAKAYDDLAQKRADSVRVIQAPITTAEPRKIQPLIILAGFILSLISALGVAAATQVFESGFITPERLERNLGLKVLAVIPYRR